MKIHAIFINNLTVIVSSVFHVYSTTITFKHVRKTAKSIHEKLLMHRNGKNVYIYLIDFFSVFLIIA